MKKVIAVALVALVASGCASLKKQDINTLKVACDEFFPCEPCPPTPVCPPAPVCPDVPVEDKEEAATSCDRDGLPPDMSTIWKPVSDGDGNLAIVTGAQFTCEGGLVVMYGKKWMNVEKRNYDPSAGRANGCRIGWRFSMPGEKYGKNIKFQCLGANGSVEREWRVPNGSNRTEFRGK